MDDRFNQVHLQYMYESAQARMKAHPEIAEKYQKIIQNYSVFESKEMVREYVFKKEKETRSYYRVFAKIDKDEEFYFTSNYYIVVPGDDGNGTKAAEYLGLEMLYWTNQVDEIA